jgi:hypothetical protein
MNIYIDENLSPFLAQGFHFLQMPENIKLREAVEVHSITEFGKGAADEDWIPMAGKTNSCILTQDFNIHRINHQHTLCEHYNLGMFYVRPPSKCGFRYWDMVKLLVKHWPEIIKIATRQSRPFAYKITSKSKIEGLK